MNQHDTNVTVLVPCSRLTFHFSTMHGSTGLNRGSSKIPIMAAGPSKTAEDLVAWIQDFHLNESLGRRRKKRAEHEMGSN